MLKNKEIEHNASTEGHKNIKASVDAYLEQGLWQDAFVQAKNDVVKSLQLLYSFLIKDYSIYEKHKNDDPEEDDTAGVWFDAFVNASTVSFLPSINNLMKVFGKAINEIDSVDAVVNYDVELEEIRNTIDAILQEE